MEKMKKSWQMIGVVLLALVMIIPAQGASTVQSSQPEQVATFTYATYVSGADSAGSLKSMTKQVESEANQWLSQRPGIKIHDRKFQVGATGGPAIASVFAGGRKVTQEVDWVFVSATLVIFYQ